MLRTASRKCGGRIDKTSVRRVSGGGGGNGASSAAKFAIYGVGTAAVGTGGAVGYAYYDPEFRKNVEDTVPVVKPYLMQIIGEPRDVRKPLPSYTSLLPKKVSEKIENKPTEKVEQKPVVEKKVEQPVAAAAAVAPAASKTSSKEKEKKTAEEDGERQKRMAQREEDIQKANQKLEKLLKSAMHTTEVLVRASQESKNAVVIAIDSHTKLLKNAVEDPNTDKKDSQWDNVIKANETAQYALTSDKAREKEARMELERLRKAVNDGRASKDTADNSVINEAAQFLSQASFKLDEAQAKINQAQMEGKIMSEFKKLIEEGRRQFAEELKAVLPNIDLKAKGQKLSEDELNAFIAHAYIRIDQLRKQLTDQQLREQQHINEALDRQKAENAKLSDERVEREIEKAKAVNEIYTNETVMKAKVEFEDELRQQLRRQAAAHSEHLEDVLTVQRQQLTEKGQRDTQEAILKEREIFDNQLASAIARLQAIETVLDGRADQDNENRRSKELWLACQRLRNAIVEGRSGKDVDSRRKPLANEIMSIKEASGGDAFVTTLVTAVPDAALAAGVYSEEDLKSRFEKVNKLCRRMARIGENGGSLMQYVLSYAQSSFIWNSPKETDGETEIDVNKMDTFDVLSRASYCVEKRDFQTAVKLMMLLKGEPARIASDWIRDTRHHLETRQVAELLTAHAAAQSAEHEANKRI